MIQNDLKLYKIIFKARKEREKYFVFLPKKRASAGRPRLTTIKRLLGNGINVVRIELSSSHQVTGSSIQSSTYVSAFSRLHRCKQVSCPHTSRLPILCQHLLLAAVSYECDSRINKDFNGLTNCSGKDRIVILRIQFLKILKMAFMSLWCGKCVKRRGRKSRAYSAREWPVTGQWLFFSSLDFQLVILQGLLLSCQLSLQPLLQYLQVRYTFSIFATYSSIVQKITVNESTDFKGNEITDIKVLKFCTT